MLTLEIITPDKTVFEGEADSVTLPTGDGEITVLPHHIPLIAVIAPGSMEVRIKGDVQIFAVSRGVIETDGKGVRVLSDIADRADALDEEAAEAAQAEAQRLMTEKREDVEGFAEATAIFERELARLRTVRRHRARRSFSPPSHS